ncbi:MAG: cyanophycinase [Bacteroidales bacterium]|nr:cyanophycinase [Bacteroidales bacterium]
MKTLQIILSSLILFPLLFSSCNQNIPGENTEPDFSLTRGPEKGSLVIVGGAMRDTNIVDRFIELAGGPGAPIVVIPTASGASEINKERVSRFLTARGAVDVTVVHTYDSLEADTPEFTEPIKRAMGLWFTGGRQWRIVDAYGGTITEQEIIKILDRGGVIGGSSAGATIQGSYLARGDTRTNTIMMGDHERGFNYLAASAIDQHLLVRNRQHDLVEVIESHPHLLGIGLDENTAIVVQGDEFEVIGKSFVAIYDYRLWPENNDGRSPLNNGGKFFLLRSGDRYNVNTREVTEWSGGSERDIFAEPDSVSMSAN